jgi:hypothetical protein
MSDPISKTIKTKKQQFMPNAIGNQPDPSVKRILFQDAAFGKSTGETITRKLAITASDQYGLPTAPDDEILVGLLQLSRIQNFAAPTVSFTLTHLSLLEGSATRETAPGLHRGQKVCPTGALFKS